MKAIWLFLRVPQSIRINDEYNESTKKLGRGLKVIVHVLGVIPDPAEPKGSINTFLSDIISYYCGMEMYIFSCGEYVMQSCFSRCYIWHASTVEDFRISRISNSPVCCMFIDPTKNGAFTWNNEWVSTPVLQHKVNLL